MNERLKGVVVTVTGVPEPLALFQDRTKVGCTKVISLTVKTKETPAWKERKIFVL